MNEQQTPIVYVVDDDQAVCRSLGLLIKGVGLEVCTYNTAEDFLAAYEPDRPGCLVVDVRMPGMSGLDLQQKLNDEGIDLPCIVITGHGDIPMAVDAMKAGVVDLLKSHSGTNSCSMTSRKRCSWTPKRATAMRSRAISKPKLPISLPEKRRL